MRLVAVELRLEYFGLIESTDQRPGVKQWLKRAALSIWMRHAEYLGTEDRMDCWTDAAHKNEVRQKLSSRAQRTIKSTASACSSGRDNLIIDNPQGLSAAVGSSIFVCNKNCGASEISEAGDKRIPWMEERADRGGADDQGPQRQVIPQVFGRFPRPRELMLLGWTEQPLMARIP